MIPARLADLSVDEFKSLLHQVVTEAITQLLGDPDVGLELREDIKANLQRSLTAVEAGGKTIPVEVVAAKLGLDW